MRIFQLFFFKCILNQNIFEINVSFFQFFVLRFCCCCCSRWSRNLPVKRNWAKEEKRQFLMRNYNIFFCLLLLLCKRKKKLICASFLNKKLVVIECQGKNYGRCCFLGMFLFFFLLQKSKSLFFQLCWLQLVI